jgi:hypothetical protein
VVRQGILAPQAIAAVRGDTFVVETNIHYPTESSLIRDGLRKVVTLAAALAVRHGQPGWRQHEHLLKKVKELDRAIGRARLVLAEDGGERLLGVAVVPVGASLVVEVGEREQHPRVAAAQTGERPGQRARDPGG